MHPIIGINCSFGFDHDADPPRARATLSAAYSDAVLAAGGLPVLFPVLPEPDTALLDELLARVDAFVLTGGYDLDPRHYGENPHPQTETMHPRREAFDLALIHRLEELRKPTLAICLGFQMLHVLRGGKLVQHIDDLPTQPRIVHHLPREQSAFHEVQIAPESLLAEIVGMSVLEVNSRHHQAVAPLHQGSNLRAVAHARDGLVEASEDTRDGRFLLAVQWHPENLIDRWPHRRLFEAVVAAAGGRGIRS